MSRTLLSLLLLFPGAALAGESAVTPDGSACAEAQAGPATADATAQRKTGASGAAEAGAVPGVKSGSDVSDHLPTPSWRSFLPGMLR